MYHMYETLTYFFKKYALLFLVVLSSTFLSACGNKGPLTVPDAYLKKNLVNSLVIYHKNES